MIIKTTEHFRERFRQRVAKTKRVSVFANRAYYFGKHSCDFKNATFAKRIAEIEITYGSTARVYANNIYWFHDNSAITVYQLPQSLHGKV